MTDAWTIPFDNTNYICWRDQNDKPNYRRMTREEEREYFTSSNKEGYLNALLRK